MTTVTAMTTATAVVPARAQGGAVDLTNPTTFQGHTLTQEQLEARLAILAALEEQLDTQGGSLAEKDAKELREIVNLTKADKRTLDISRPFPICRLTAPHYFVKLTRTKLDFYGDVQRKITEAPNTSVGILRAVQPMTQANWFQTAIFNQVESVLSSDFMDALNATFMGNMCILRASLLLMGKPDIFREVLFLYSTSSDLYNTQITYNRQFESELLSTTKETYDALKALHKKIKQICGDELNETPQLAEAVQTYRMAEAEAMKRAQQTILTHCDTFLKAIQELKINTQNCIKKITTKNTRVEEALIHMTKLMQQQEILAEKQAKMQKKYEAFQNEKQKEVNSRLVTDKKTEYKILFITFWRSIKTQITEEDFRSKETYQEYIELQKEEAILSAAIKGAQGILATTMSGVIAYGQDKNSLHSSMHVLATSILCVKQLEIALQQQQRQAHDQLSTCERILMHKGRTGGLEDPRVEIVLALIHDEIEKTIQKQAVWLASHRQTFTLKNFQKVEEAVRTTVILTLTTEGGDISELVAKASALLKAYLPTDVENPEQVQRAVQVQLVPYKKMLQLSEGTYDADQKV